MMRGGVGFTMATPAQWRARGRGRKARLMARFAEWHPDIPKVLDATPESAILRNDIHYLPPLPRWSRGRIVLFGDAAPRHDPGTGLRSGLGHRGRRRPGRAARRP